MPTGWTRYRVWPTGAALVWLDTGWTERPGSVTERPVFAQCDPNLANHLWDGERVRLVDFEAAGRGDEATELADFVEHLTVWAHRASGPRAFSTASTSAPVSVGG
jgi:Ser/Thr protein kinase RdoA (MazF antagonist)